MINLEAAKATLEAAEKRLETCQPLPEVSRALHVLALLIDQHRTLRDNQRALSRTMNYGADLGEH